MNGEAWIGGVAATLWFGYMSLMVRRWWPLFYLLTLFFGMGAGAVIAVEHHAAAWLWGALWCGYGPTLPIVRVWLARKRERNIYDAP